MRILLTILLLSFNLVSAQNGQDFVNMIIVPSIVIFIFLFGIVSFLKFPKIISLVFSLSITGFFYMTNIIQKISATIASLGGLASTGIYILLFLLGATLASKTSIKSKKAIRLADIRRMNRSQISMEMGNIEKRIAELQGKIENLKIQEHNLEIQFASSRDAKILKELEKLRKIKNEMSDALDMLIEKREYYKRSYREIS